MKIGAHNLHDQAGRPTFFAGIVFFTEAIPTTILARAARRWGRLRGFDVVTCDKQPDLVIAYRRKWFTPIAGEYRLAHKGIEKVTPHRGTYVLTGRLRDGRKVALLVEHRINAAFPPYVRGEGHLRNTYWHRHTVLTSNWIVELHAAGYAVIAGGDINTPHKQSAYGGLLREVGRGLDRLGLSGSLGRLIDLEYLDNEGSDHPRIRATVEAHKH